MKLVTTAVTVRQSLVVTVDDSAGEASLVGGPDDGAMFLATKELRAMRGADLCNGEVFILVPEVGGFGSFP